MEWSFTHTQTHTHTGKEEGARAMCLGCLSMVLVARAHTPYSKYSHSGGFPPRAPERRPPTPEREARRRRSPPPHPLLRCGISSSLLLVLPTALFHLLPPPSP